MHTWNREPNTCGCGILFGCPSVSLVSFHGEGFVRQDVSHVVSPDGSFSLSVLYRLSAAMASEDQLLFHITGADGADSLSLIVNHDRIRMLKNGQIRDDSIYGVQPARNEWHKVSRSEKKYGKCFKQRKKGKRNTARVSLYRLVEWCVVFLWT